MSSIKDELVNVIAKKDIEDADFNIKVSSALTEEGVKFIDDLKYRTLKSLVEEADDFSNLDNDIKNSIRDAYFKMKDGVTELLQLTDKNKDVKKSAKLIEKITNSIFKLETSNKFWEKL